MALLDRILELLGTNRTRMQWKVRAWRRAWDRRTERLANRGQALTYAHQTCPRCAHPAGADEKVCTRCGEPLGGVLAHRARKLGALVWAPETPVVATLLGIAIIATYAATLLWDRQVGLAQGLSLGPSGIALYRFGSMHTDAIAEGEWWRLVTGTFLHINLLHLAFNLSSLWSAASYLEEVLGKAKTLALYLWLGVAASATSYVWHTQTWPYSGASAGASGAICGLIGVAIGFSLRRRNVARHLRGHYIGWGIWIGILALSGWRIDNAGHFGGLVPGLALGLVVRRRSETSGTARRAWQIAAALAVAIAIAAFVLAGRTEIPPAWLQDPG